MTDRQHPKLVIVKGPEAGREFPIYAGSTTIGRDPSNTIVSTGSGVSRKHAQFNIDNNVATVQDLGSANGTFVNDIRISSPHVLAPGDSIRLGQSVEMQYAAPVVTGPAATIVESGASPAPPARSGGATVVRQAPRDAAATMLGDIGDVSAAAGPSTLVVETAGGKSQTYTLTAEHYTIGRADDNDIVVDSKIVSRHHARLHRSASGYQLEQLPDVGNQIYVQGRSIPGLHNLEHGEVFRIGGVDPGTMVTFRYASPATAAQSVAAVDIQFGERMLLQIGRDASNDIRLDVPHVSRYHAQIERVGQRYRVRDLRSSNGTFVNGNRITAETWLKPNDEIRVGPYRFVLGDERLAQYDESSGLRVDAVGLNKWVRKDLNILQDISLVFKPREFIVVVGQSGGGKSTLVDAIAGYRPATHGRVLVNGINVYENFDAIRNEIGFVPQKDIIHMELTVFQALDYAAQLRMPSDTGKKERHARVLEVLRDLDLEHRKDVQISGLSGGQQKRVSIGVELLTKPGLFFLDEPTSGLDPGTETALMQLMRHLADQGRTIVLITHATKNVMLADKVVFLARGGYLTWFGPPDEALQYFNQYRSERDQRAGEMEFDGIYAILDDPSKGSPKEWAQRYKEYTAYQNYVVQPLQQGGQSLGASAAVGAPRAKRARRVSSLRQLAILSARNIKILTRDRFSLTLMLAAAPLVGLLDFVLATFLGKNPFSHANGSVPDTMTSLFLLTVYAVMVGGLAQMREIVKELDIYKRERLVNLKIIPYVVSKVWVAGLLALYQAAAYTLIRYIAFDMPGGVFEFVLIYITMALATMAGMMLGLFASALAPNANSAPMIVILFMLPQIVLGGAIIPLPGSGQFVSGLTSTRWAFEALISTVGIGSDIEADQCWALDEDARAALTLDDKVAFDCNCLGPNVFDETRCNVPQVGTFYDEAIDQPEPVAPAPIGSPPPQPVQPEPPQPPADQSDAIAVADYLQALEAYQAEVEELTRSYEAQLAAFQAQADVYEAQVEAYSTEFGEWQIRRTTAIGGAESMINELVKNFGWTFVDKNNPTAFAIKIGTTWLAQSAIISILFVLILVLVKRKDVN